MAALAIFSKEKGDEVTGSDTEETFVTDKLLAKAGIPVYNFDPQNLKAKPDLVVVSAAYGKDNVEVKEARKKKLEIKLYSEFLGDVSYDSGVIAVSGIHGKTTTTAIISFLLTKAHLDPSFIIGSGEIPSLGTVAHAGKGDYFVLEADEYRKSPEDPNSKFFDLSPKIEIITSIEMDHPDLFSTDKKVYETFYKFACRIPRTGFIVLCLDYQKSNKLLHSLVDRHFETYGFQPGALWQIVDFKTLEDFTSFSLAHNGDIVGPFKIKIPGAANALNATAAIITALKLGLDEKIIKKYLAEFTGVKRRFEEIGKVQDTIIIDDYAHHPHSIALTLETVKNKFPGYKIYCIFQPHTYSRTKTLLLDFAKAFKVADIVIVTEIFASAREEKKTISGADLATAIRKFNRNVKFIDLWDKIIQEISDNLHGPSIVITMGAGDIYKLARQILEELK